MDKCSAIPKNEAGCQEVYNEHAMGQKVLTRITLFAEYLHYIDYITIAFCVQTNYFYLPWNKRGTHEELIVFQLLHSSI